MLRVVALGLLAVLVVASAGNAVGVRETPPAPIPNQEVPVGPEPCSPGSGCLPFYVDEAGDTMTGALQMVNSWINFPARGDGVCLGCLGPAEFDAFGAKDAEEGSQLTGDLMLLRMPVNLTSVVSLLAGSRLNATAGGTIFIDFLGNLTFADGSWMNNDGAFFEHVTTYNNTVYVQGNGSQLVVANGAELVFNNAGGILTTEGIGRVGTIDNNPFRIIVNNETALLFLPGSTPNLIGGYNGNSAVPGLIGVVIAGGGGNTTENTATANFTSILGGDDNLAAGVYAVVLGGQGNTAAGNHSAAAGRNAGALHDGTFVWGDSQGSAFDSTDEDQFLVRAAGGVGINTNAPVSALTVEGDITPATNDAHSLGSATHRWDQLFMASEIDYASDLLYTNGGITRMTLTTGGNLALTGNFSVGGTIAGTFVGDGSALMGVVATDLADASVTSNKLANGAVTGAKIGSGTVTSTHLGAGAVTNSALGANAVTSDKITDGTVGTADLASGAVTPAKMAPCAAGQILKYSGTAWTCAADGGATYDAGTGLALTGSTFSIANSGVGSAQIADDAVTFAKIQDCSEGDVLEHTGIAWTCGTDANNAYFAGDALDLDGDTFAVALGGIRTEHIENGTIGAADVNASQVQVRIGATCTPGAFITGINEDGTVVCATDGDTTYSAGDGLQLVGNTFSIADLAVTAAKIANSAVTSAKIASGAVGSTQLADGGVTSTKIASGAVGSTQIADGGVATADLANLAVTSGKIADGAVTSTKIASGAVGTTQLADLGVAEADLANLAVTSGKIADGAVTSTKIASGAVGTTQLADLGVATADIANLAVTAGKLADGSVTTAKILDGTIGSADIDANAIQRRVTGTCASGQAIGTISSTGTVTCNTLSDAQTLDGIDSSQFLRSDASDSFTSGTLTIASGSKLAIDGTVSSDIIPTTNATYKLGDNTHRYTDLYLASKIHFMTGIQFVDGDNEVMMNLSGNSLNVFDSISSGTLTALGGGISIEGDEGALEFAGGTEKLRWSTSLGGFQVTDDLDVVGTVVASGDIQTSGGLHLGAGSTTGDDYLTFDWGAEHLRWNEALGRFDLSDDIDVTGTMESDGLGVGVAPSTLWRTGSVQTNTADGTGAVRGDGVFGPTRGYLGVQGATDFDGVLSADWSGRELGVVGISTGGSNTDNWGVMGHSNGVGVRGEHSGNPTVDYAELGKAGVGLEASGSTLAGQFLGNVDIDGTLTVDGAITSGGNTLCAGCPGTRGTFGTQTIIGFFDAEAGRQRIHERSAGVSLCYFDADANAVYSLGDSVYVNIDQDNCADNVEAGDIRMTPAGGFSVYTRVSAAHSDFNRPLSVGNTGSGSGIQEGQPAVKWFDANGNGLLSPGDSLYIDMDNSATVTSGDVRLNAYSSFGAGSVVVAGNSDVNNPLRNPLATNFDFIFSWWDLDWDGVLDTNEPLYLDMDDDERTSGGDFRIDSIASFV